MSSRKTVQTYACIELGVLSAISIIALTQGTSHAEGTRQALVAMACGALPTLLILVGVTINSGNCLKCGIFLRIPATFVILWVLMLVIRECSGSWGGTDCFAVLLFILIYLIWFISGTRMTYAYYVEVTVRRLLVPGQAWPGSGPGNGPLDPSSQPQNSPEVQLQPNYVQLMMMSSAPTPTAEDDG